MTRSQLIVAFALVVLIGTAALGQTSDRVQTFTGTYTCIACDLQKTTGVHAQCDIYGHDFGLKLNDGTYIHFLPNDHSVALVKGGGRTNFPITVTGMYDRNAHTIDVQKYWIDGIETTWSAESNKMVTLSTHKQLLAKPTAPKNEQDNQLTKR